MNLNKLAAQDAAKWAGAQMFFGEGAGTRRKLLNAEILDKQAMIPGYYDMFMNAYEKQNMAEHALRAVKERKHIDRATKLGKNVKSVLRGDKRGLSTGVLIIVGVGYVAHQTGYDRIALEEGKKYYRKIRAEIAARKLHNGTHKWYSVVNEYNFSKGN